LDIPERNTRRKIKCIEREFFVVILPVERWDPFYIPLNIQSTRKGKVGPTHKFRESYVGPSTNVFVAGVTAGKRYTGNRWISGWVCPHLIGGCGEEKLRLQGIETEAIKRKSNYTFVLIAVN